METQEVAIEVSAGPTFRAATPPPEVKEEASSGTYRPDATGAGAELFPEVAQSVVVGASLLELCNQKGALMNKRHTVLTPSGDAMREWLLKATPADMATRPERCTESACTPPLCARIVLSASQRLTDQMIRLPSTPPLTMRVGSAAADGP